MLSGDINAEVVIIGGGVAGLSLALNLSKSGYEVVLIEQRFCGSGASEKSFGLASQNFELNLPGVIERFGEEKAKLLWNLTGTATTQFKDNNSDLATETDFSYEDSVFFATTPQDQEKVQKIHDARKKFGSISRLLTSEQCRELVASNKYYGGVRYPGSSAVNPFRYCRALLAILQNSGVKIFESTPVVKIENNSVVTTKGKVTAKYIVICANSFTNDYGITSEKLSPRVEYLGASRELTEPEIKGIFHSQHFNVWDSGAEGTHFRIDKNKRLIVGSKKESLDSYVKEMFPTVTVPLEFLWSSKHSVSADGLPFAGKMPKTHTYYIAGTFGLIWATALGNYMAEKIHSNRTDLDDIFSVSRKVSIVKQIKSKFF